MFKYIKCFRIVCRWCACLRARITTLILTLGRSETMAFIAYAMSHAVTRYDTPEILFTNYSCTRRVNADAYCSSVLGISYASIICSTISKPTHVSELNSDYTTACIFVVLLIYK